MADTKISALAALITPNDEDLLVIIDDPNGTPVSKSISIKTLVGNIPSNTSITGTLAVSANVTSSGVSSNNYVAGQTNLNGLSRLNQLVVANNSFIISTAKTPSSASDTGTLGQIAWDTGFIYICTATNTWERVAIATW